MPAYILIGQMLIGMLGNTPKPPTCCVTHCCAVLPTAVLSPTAALCHPLLCCVTHCCDVLPTAVFCRPWLWCVIHCCVVSPAAVLCHPLPCCHPLLCCVTHCYVVSPIAVLSPTAVLLHPLQVLCHPLQCCVTHCYVVSVPLLCCRICWRKERPCHVPSAKSLCRKRMAVIGYDAPSARRRFAGSPRDRGGGLR